MENKSYFQVTGVTAPKVGAPKGISPASAGVSILLDTAISFGVGYLYAKKEKGENNKLLERLSKLDKELSEKLKLKIEEAVNESAKTAVIIEFFNEEKIKELEKETETKRILPIIGLVFITLVLGLIFYKVNRKNG